MTEYIDVDVRPILQAGGEPFSVIMSALGKPAPLQQVRQGQSPAGGERGLEFGKLVRPSFTTTTSPSKIAVATERSNAAAIDGKRLVQSNPVWV